MKVLVTGFEPFGGESINPAWEAVKKLPDSIARAEIIKIQVPTTFKGSGIELDKAMEKHSPQAVLCVGQAGGRSCISIERVAINLAEASMPDNEGYQPQDEKIKCDGENAYFASIPVKAIIDNVRKNGLPAHISYTAGTYVCNSLMYTLLYLIDKKYPAVKGGFIHVPYACEQVADKGNGLASLPIETISKGIECAIEAIVTSKDDKSIVLGETH